MTQKSALPSKSVVSKRRSLLVVIACGLFTDHKVQEWQRTEGPSGIWYRQCECRARTQSL